MQAVKLTKMQELLTALSIFLFIIKLYQEKLCFLKVRIEDKTFLKKALFFVVLCEIFFLYR